MASDAKVLNLEEFEDKGELQPGGHAIKIKVCFWKKRGLWVVMKVIRLTQTYTTEHFHREVGALAAAQSDCLVIFHGIISQSETGMIVLQLASGGDLSGAIGSLTPGQQATIMFDVLRALELLHTKGILHLNLKPANVLLDEGRIRARLTDFGAAHISAEGQAVMTRSIMTDYAAPELAFGVVTRAADIWSFGVLLYEVIAGNPMQTPAHVQFATGNGIDLSGIANPRARRLIARCLVPMGDRLTFEQLEASFSAWIFGAETVQKQIVVKRPAKTGARPPAKSATAPTAKSPAISPAPLPTAAPSADPPAVDAAARSAAAESTPRIGVSSALSSAKLPARSPVRLAAVPVPAAPAGCTEDFRPCWELAHRGAACAQCWIGQQFLDGKSGVKRDIGAAASWFRRSAEGGDAGGMSALAWCYQKGEGVKKDWSATVSWFRKSAQRGGTDGMRGVGYCYQNGWGVRRDLNAAVIWFRKSAAGGNSGGMYSLAWCYQNGWGVQKDWVMANFWFAQSGRSPDAMCELS